jgi:anhydro-N-acetylmuramic acid kinase
MTQLFIGLMSGTSMDGVDAVLTDFSSEPPRLLATASRPLPAAMRQGLLALCSGGGADELGQLAQLDVEVGRLFGQAAMAVLKQAGIAATEIAAIGSHGQTVRHRPDAQPPYTVQIGDPNTIAEHTGITTVADFRRRDMAAGGQGAPLVPAFHAAAFRSADEHRVVVNIGGIANITVLPADPQQPVTGFDTGPGNVLLDAWIWANRGLGHDAEGRWAATGQIDGQLLEAMLNDPFLRRKPPKSTGREHFNPSWLKNMLAGRMLDPNDVQATLAEYTARTIALAVDEHAHASERVLVCGGGAHNTDLMQRLQRCLPARAVQSTAAHGLEPDWVEAVAFAWLARQTLHRCAGNVAAVTGARHPVVLGGIYPGAADT